MASNLWQALENETLEIFSMAKRSKSKHKFGKMEVCKVDEVREYFMNP